MPTFTASRLETWARNVVLTDRWLEITRGLSRAGIDCLTHKGMALIHTVYPDPGLRPMADVDLLVRPDDAGGAVRVLSDAGYCAVEAPNDGRRRPYLVAERGGVTIDLHWHLAHYSRFDGIVAVDHDGVWRRARPLATPAGDRLTLSAEDTLLHVALHLTLGSEFGRLVWFSDVDALVRAYADTLDWDLVLSEATRWRVRVIVGYVLDVARAALGSPVPDSVARRFRPDAGRRAALRACLAAPCPPSVARIGDSRVYLGETLLMDRGRDVARVFGRSVFPSSEWTRSHYEVARAWQVPVFRLLHPFRFCYLAAKHLR